MTKAEFKEAANLVMKIDDAERMEAQLKANIATLFAKPITDADDQYYSELDLLRLKLSQAVSTVIEEYAKNYRERFSAL